MTESITWGVLQIIESFKCLPYEMSFNSLWQPIHVEALQTWEKYCAFFSQQRWEFSVFSSFTLYFKLAVWVKLYRSLYKYSIPVVQGSFVTRLQLFTYTCLMSVIHTSASLCNHVKIPAIFVVFWELWWMRMDHTFADQKKKSRSCVHEMLSWSEALKQAVVYPLRCRHAATFMTHWKYWLSI